MSFQQTHVRNHRPIKSVHYPFSKLQFVFQNAQSNVELCLKQTSLQGAAHVIYRSNQEAR